MAKKLSKFQSTVTIKKSQIMVTMLKRPKGASIRELAKVTDWQAHSLRGFLSGTLKKRQGLAITSTRDEGKDRRYRIEEAQ